MGTDREQLCQLEDTIVKIIDLEREINRDIDRLIDMKAAARASINAMANPDERLILEMRYLCYKTWTEIAETIGWFVNSVLKKKKKTPKLSTHMKQKSVTKLHHGIRYK